MIGQVCQVEAVARQGQIMSLHQNTARQLEADHHVTADRNALSCDDGIDCVLFLPKAEVEDCFHLSQARIDRPRGGEPMLPVRRRSIRLQPVEMDQRKLQQIGGRLDRTAPGEQLGTTYGEETVPDPSAPAAGAGAEKACGRRTAPGFGSGG